MVVNLYLFRHGETDDNLNRDIISGRNNNSVLSERGILQASALGMRLAEEGIKFDIVASSTAVRAAKTADITCNLIGFPIEKIFRTDQLAEVSSGEWEGKRKSVLYTKEVIRAMNGDSFNWAATGGESQKMVGERSYNWIDENILSPAEGKDVTAGIFGHSYAIKCVLQRIMDWDPDLTYRVIIDNCSITQLRYVSEEGEHPGWHLVKINDNAHLWNIGLASLTYAK